jgi:hypothetical protein
LTVNYTASRWKHERKVRQCTEHTYQWNPVQTACPACVWIFSRTLSLLFVEPWDFHLSEQQSTQVQHVPAVLTARSRMLTEPNISLQDLDLWNPAISCWQQGELFLDSVNKFCHRKRNIMCEQYK